MPYDNCYLAIAAVFIGGDKINVQAKTKISNTSDAEAVATLCMEL